MTAAALDFDLPPELAAREPVEAHGGRRDDVRLLVSRGDDEIEHRRFTELPRLLEDGDLVVVNNSATVPAAVDAVPEQGPPVVVHVSTARPDGTWLVEVRRPAGGSTTPWPAGRGPARAGLRLAVARGSLTLVRPETARLWVAAADVPGGLVALLAEHGRPIRYSYTDRDWPLSAYQNAYATEPGSAEMPSAGRPLTAAVLAELAGRGITVAPITLHTGVASAEVSEPPYPEWFAVRAPTAGLIGHVRERGGRVIAVGTTVVRALESAVDSAGRVRAACGWTDLVVGGDRPVRSVDGLLTGLHEPRASHLQMLTAVAGEPALRAGYAAALRERYRWHEFGDVHLLLPDRRHR
ncbi:S-adenosylmethionine:tRNA ribosyltransferase-isomerase [Mangrovihabitans endophyticus]|uniref:S-adenosylmethionine:tRNA ribosyltransferase-isomerase n=1 Tax=Mangrovihabitans endophyticus TaxID=1751298 RepID=A0A8J3FM76_9ACTN|nr:S-adenosylmethionine:tRNA ribosyltransferase-isomerase [Mangrovihabitans endophyticus]GGK77225.1 S-adenosylmethionine:tRNA ribosyltransferase-isomerase [Mangrovihabitans endophyticus]